MAEEDVKQETVEEPRSEMPADVLRREYEEAKADMLKYKKQVKELTRAQETLEEKIKSTTDSELAEQQKFKELADIRAKELDEVKSQLKQLEETAARQQLNSAIADELQKRGIKADPAWVKAESIEEIGAAMDQFEKDHPHLKTQSTATSDNRTPVIHSSERWWMKKNPTPEEFQRMEPAQYAEWRKNYSSGSSAFGSI